MTANRMIASQKRLRDESNYIALRLEVGDVPPEIEARGHEAEIDYLTECAIALTDEELRQAIARYT